MNKLLSKGKNLLTNPQDGILSAASIIMLMVIVSRVLGLLRQRTLAHFFAPNELSLFFAAFRLPDLVFEVLVFGTFSSAFIPVFTKVLKKGDHEAWDIAGRIVNIGLVIFGVFALVFGLFANEIYSIIAPGYTANEIKDIAQIARILFAAQGFFVVSYVLTGVLESLRRFLIPALAPVFYNLGIILGTVLLYPRFGLFAPAIGVVAGSAAHFLIQLPLSRKLGFRFSLKFRPNEGVKNIGSLASPRIIDLSFDQIGKTIELSLASLISTASYTYFTFANTLQLLPVSLFGTSIAKAALPTLSHQGADDIPGFRKTLMLAIFQSTFFTIPIAAILMVLRVPIVRLVYGTEIFDWMATVQTGMVLSAFAVGIVAQTLVAIFVRGFFALHDSRTPVYVSMIGLVLLILGDVYLVLNLHFPVWALAASFSASTLVEAVLLFFLMNKKIGGILSINTLKRLLKIVIAALMSGALMYLLLKFFDRSVWVKRLSFLGKLQAERVITFERFVIDTRYTLNLVVLTVFVAISGILVYIGLLLLFRSQEVWTFFNLVRKLVSKGVGMSIPKKESELVSPTTRDTSA